MTKDTSILIRPFHLEDASAFYEAAAESVSTVGRWLPWCHEKFSTADALAWMNECMRNLALKTSYDPGIFSLKTNRLLGGISINQINTQYNFGNIGYWVRQSEQNKGIATEALRLIIPYGFDQLNITRLEIAIVENNIASRKVAVNVGATFETIARNRLLKDNKPCAAAMYSIIPPC